MSVVIKMPEDFLRRIAALGEREPEIAAKCVKAGADVVEAAVRSNLKSVLSGQSSGELLKALGQTPVKVDRSGNTNIKVGFSEPRSGGGSNAMIANILEYGRGGGQVQPPRPFLKPAKTKSQKAAKAAMQAVLESEVRAL
jgi:hypothetical protein